MLIEEHEFYYKVQSKYLIQSDSSVAKIKSLHERILEIFKEMKNHHKDSIIEITQSLEDVELTIDICSREVMEYIEKKGID
jgi:uncharacterized coiled-coil DUF342 family protein